MVLNSIMVDDASAMKSGNDNDIFKELDKFGRFQKWQYFWICLPLIMTSMTHVNYIFVAEDVDYRCKVPECEDSNSSIKTPDWWPTGVSADCYKPVLDQEQFNQTHKTCSNSTFLDVVEECHDWIYETSNSIVAELNLGCQAWKATLVGSIHNAGMIFSMMFAGWISDKIGRKPTMILCSIGGSIGVVKVFLKNYYVYLMVEFIESVLSSGLYTVAVVLLIEVGGDTKRVMAGVIFSYAVYMGEIAFACTAMGLKYWKYLLLVIYTPLLLFVSYFWLLREGTRWQMLRGRMVQAKRTFRRIAKTNKIAITPQQIDDISDADLRQKFSVEIQKHKENIKDILHSKPILVRMAVTCVCFFSSSFLYYGMLVHAVLLPGDKYVNFLLSSVTSFPGDMLAFYTFNKYGRKITLQIGYLATAVFLLATHFSPESMSWLKVALFLSSKLGVVVCFTGIYTYSLELFPTSVRGSLVGLGSTAARVGSMMAPLTPLLVTLGTSPLMSALPNVLFSSSAVIAALLLSFTPETMNLPMFDTIEQISRSNQPDTDNGKGLFATKQYEKDEVILEEDPLMSCQFAWNAAYRYLACDFCMRPLETPEENVRRLSCKQDIVLPHPDCYETNLENITSCNLCGTLYCSEGCRERAFTMYHMSLCHSSSDAQHPINVLLDVWKQMHYPPETTSIMLLVRLLAYIHQSAAPIASAARIKQFCHRTTNEDAELVHKLLGEEFSDQLNTLRDLTRNVISGEHVQDFLSPEGFCSLMALVGTNGQGIGTSPLAMWVNAVTDLTMSDDEKQQLDVFIDKLYQYVEEESGTFLNTEGSGLYMLQSASNHSCSPNAESTFPYGNHRIQLKALTTIVPGDEICISYLDECALQRSRHTRQKELAQNYLFVCWCERCTAQSADPDVTSDDGDDMSDDDGDGDGMDN